MEKFKICPVCGMHNKPNMIECIGCETDLTSVKATDEATEQAKITAQENTSENVEEKYVRVCDCGCINSATAKKCVECGEDISDIAPILQSENNTCKYVMTSLDGEYAYEIKDGTAILGRENEMKEYLADKAYVSRQHAKIMKDDDKVYIENLSNTNFTFINNQKIAEKTELHVDDEIGLGGNETNGSRQSGAAYLILRNV
jgi:hypothetical protein